MKFFITGGAGFIGSNLIDRLVSEGHSIIVYDDLSTGKEFFIRHHYKSSKFKFIKGDMLDYNFLLNQLDEDVDFVFHLAANADVRFGTENTRKDLEQNTIATYNILEAMRVKNIKKIAFASTGSIYGEPDIFPTPEDCSFPVQTSFYGAAKLAGEGLLEAFSAGFGFKVYIFRFVSILGERYTHGHVFDFYKKLLQNPNEINILGNGKQTKSYLNVRDCISAILIAIEKSTSEVNIYNLGTDEYCTVDQSLDIITNVLSLKPKRIYSGGIRGWVGDSPFIFLKCDKIKNLGWQPKLTIKESIIQTLKYLIENKDLLFK